MSPTPSVPPLLPPQAGGGARPWLAALVVAALAAPAAVLYLFNPVEHGFYPVCVLHRTTGLDCPGCGGLRAVHALLHGRLGAAFALNPLVFLAGPLLGLSLGGWLVETFTGRPGPSFFTRPVWAWGAVLVLVGFGVCRNLPAVRALGLAH